MTALTRPRALGAAGLAALCLALVLPASSMAATAPKYTVESKQAYESQLHKGEIASAGVNTDKRSLRLKLKNGKLVLFRYPAGATTKVEGELRAKGATVERVGTHKKKKSKTLGSHPRRTIAIIVVVVLVLAGVAFLLWRRRRLGRD
jgi:hypothetical protein